MKSAPKQYRQGDVLLEAVGSLPSKLKPVLRQRGRLILANGNSGHAHYVDDDTAELFQAEDGEQFLKAGGVLIKGRLPIVEKNKLHVLLRHPKLGVIAFNPVDLVLSAKTAGVDGSFTLLIHDSQPNIEHEVHAVSRGIYVQVDQSEYNSDEVRRVTD